MTTGTNTKLINLAIKTEDLNLYRDRIATLRRINLTPRQLCDLEMLIDGSFSPLTGFLSADDYDSVVRTMRLTTGSLWPVPITFDVREKDISSGEEILLCDKYGGPLAILTVSSTYEPDKLREAKEVYGTTDKAHPGVRYLLEETGDIYLGGRILGLASPANHSFTDLRQTPQQLQDWFTANGWNKIIGFQTRNPIHRAHYELIRRSAEDHAAKVLIHPVVGETKPGDIDYITRVRCYRKISDLYARDFAKLSLLPLAMRMAGPREALWHALIRKNYGCTHFIVGRNHADPGPGSDGQPLYGTYDAQDLTRRYEPELGLTIIPQSEIAYVPSEKKYLFANELQPHHQTLSISGTELRRLIRAGEEVPDWLSFPEVVSELRLTAQRELKRGVTIFMTGLSGSGKSTITKIVQDKLAALQEREITVLDGDVIRQNLSKGLGFSREDRDTNILRIGFVANEITRHGGFALCAAIAPYRETRNKNRELIGQTGTYIEVLVDAPMEVCRQRDVKGLYRKAELGKLKGFTGVDDPYERPENAEIVLDTVNLTPEQCAQQVVDYLLEVGIVISKYR